MKPIVFLMAWSIASGASFAQGSPETLVCIRHGEKQPGGLGQLTCQGFNRALALPKVLLAKYGQPQFLFAPDPSQTIDEYGTNYCYVRPLASIEPTAIYCGLPVNTLFGYGQISQLEQELQKPDYQSATVFICWEHVLLVNFAQDMVTAYGGDPSQVPVWGESDYDTIFVVRITRGPGQASVTFTVDHEGLSTPGSDCSFMQTVPIGPGVPGIRTNRFGFAMAGPSNEVVVVEASATLANPTWSPLKTNTLTVGAGYFDDVLWTNYPSRFYRLRFP